MVSRHRGIVYSNEKQSSAILLLHIGGFHRQSPIQTVRVHLSDIQDQTAGDRANRSQSGTLGGSIDRREA